MAYRLVLALAIVLAIASCKGSGSASDPCREAKQIYMDHMRHKQAEGVASVVDATDRAKLQQEGDAELERADARFLYVCKELGGTKLLACMKKAQSLEATKDPAAAEKMRSDPECVLLDSLRGKLYAP